MFLFLPHQDSCWMKTEVNCMEHRTAQIIGIQKFFSQVPLNKFTYTHEDIYLFRVEENFLQHGLNCWKIYDWIEYNGMQHRAASLYTFTQYTVFCVGALILLFNGIVYVDYFQVFYLTAHPKKLNYLIWRCNAMYGETINLRLSFFFCWSQIYENDFFWLCPVNPSKYCNFIEHVPFSYIIYISHTLYAQMKLIRKRIKA